KSAGRGRAAKAKSCPQPRDGHGRGALPGGRGQRTRESRKGGTAPPHFSSLWWFATLPAAATKGGGALAQLDEIQTKLKEIAETVNLFKSEAVQLRVLDLLVGQLEGVGATPPAPRSRRRAKPARKAKEQGSEEKPARAASRSSKGPATAINKMLEGDFFKS